MRRVLLTLFMVCIFGCTPVLSQEQQEKTPPAPTENKEPTFARLYSNGQFPGLGEYIELRRPFGRWILKCDLDLKADKRVCLTEQLITLGDYKLLWKIMSTTSGQPYVVVVSDKPLEKPLIRMGFSGLEKVMEPRDGLQCGPENCIGMFALDGLIQYGILSAETVNFTIETKDGLISSKGYLAGLQEALQAAATNPYGLIAKTPPAANNKKAAPQKKSNKTTNTVRKIPVPKPAPRPE